MSKSLVSAQAIETGIFKIKGDLNSFLGISLEGQNLEGKVIAVTSKIVSLAEGKVVSPSTITKLDLIKKEADHYLGSGGHGSELTIKHGILIPSAGIDESNSQTGDFILFPSDPYESAKNIWVNLKSYFNLKNFGVIITDSHTLPLRRGVTGIGLSHWGFRATKSLVNQEDLFGRTLKFTHVDVLDALATMAVFVMGESNDQTPLAILSGADIEYTNHSSSDEIAIDREDDLYGPLLAGILDRYEL